VLSRAAAAVRASRHGTTRRERNGHPDSRARNARRNARRVPRVARPARATRALFPGPRASSLSFRNDESVKSESTWLWPQAVAFMLEKLDTLEKSPASSPSI